MNDQKICESLMASAREKQSEEKQRQHQTMSIAVAKALRILKSCKPSDQRNRAISYLECAYPHVIKK